MPSEEVYHHGIVSHAIRGKLTHHEAILCCPGAWTEIKAQLGIDDSWTTLRMGSLLLAEGPPCSDAIPGLLPLERLRDTNPVVADSLGGVYSGVIQSRDGLN